MDLPPITIPTDIMSSAHIVKYLVFASIHNSDQLNWKMYVCFISLILDLEMDKRTKYYFKDKMVIVVLLRYLGLSETFTN